MNLLFLLLSYFFNETKEAKRSYEALDILSLRYIRYLTLGI